MHTDGEGTHEIIAQYKIPVAVSFKSLAPLPVLPKEKSSLLLENSQYLCFRIKLKTRKNRIYAKLRREAQNFETEP